MATTIDPTAHAIEHADIVEANALQVGDIIVNVGCVQQVRRDGVFVTAAVRGTEWSLATGTGDVVSEDITWHETNEILIHRER
jgi:hypothetical protein